MPIADLEFLRQQSRSTDAALAAVSDNCRFDERASAARWQQFEDVLQRVSADRGAIGWPEWGEASKSYLEQHCQVPSPSVPDAFLEINHEAWLTAPAANQDLVRLELLTRVLDGIHLPELAERLRRSDSGKDEEARRAVEAFFEAWNQRRDSRPAFATPYDQVKDESDSADWPHALRDRLGLGHYGCRDGNPLPVALMRYSLAEAFQAQNDRGAPVACALPTVLDGGMHEYFFPVPRERTFGATLHLTPGLADTLTAEILHCRIEYRRKHLWKLGLIEGPRELRDDALREARDLHLLALQVLCNRGDFGEPMVGRK